MPENNTAKSEGVEVTVVQDADDFVGFFNVAAKAFGEQVHDAIWEGLSPGWDTPAGKAANVARMAARWQKTTTNAQGQPNTIFLKATVPDPATTTTTNGTRIVGVAIWAQLSFAAGHGDTPSTQLPDSAAMGYASADEERFGKQLFAGLMAKRVAVLREKADTDSPAAFVLDLCAVDPDYQRRGIAARLVRWGLEEAERRGGLEATTEASVMGRFVYSQLGFKAVGEIEYGVDAELVGGRQLPSNLFMRTRP